MKFLKIYLLTLILTSVLFLPGVSLAKTNGAEESKYLQTCNPKESLEVCQKRLLGEAGGGSSGYGANTNITEQTLAEKVGQVIGMVLSVFGVVFFCLVVYSGIQWMTAGGNEEKVTHARERIIRAAIGLGIVMMAWALTSFIVNRLQTTAIEPGQVINCSDLENQLECQNQSLYCQWNVGDNTCGGIQVDCSELHDEESCLSSGCSWTEDFGECAN